MSTLLKDMVFLVLNTDDKKLSKLELQNKIKQNGGEIVENYVKQVSHIISDTNDVITMRLHEQLGCNFIRSDWVINSIHKNMILPLAPRFLIKKSEDFQQFYS